MRQTKTLLTLALMFSLFFPCCKSNTAPVPGNNKDTVKVESKTDPSASFVYDPLLDPSKVAPANVKMWHDTLGMKLFEITLKPGDSLPLHAHPDHAFYILEGGTVAFTPKGAARQIVEFISGSGFINGPFTDAGKNIGKTTIRLLEVDVYRPRVQITTK